MNAKSPGEFLENFDKMPIESLSSLIDHTVLGPTVTRERVEKLCKEAVERKFCSVCVNPDRVVLAKELTAGSGVAVCTVIGFPHGVNVTAVKVLEAKLAVADGADEIDMVMNIGTALEGEWESLTEDIRAVREAIGTDVILKVIIESSLLSDEQIVAACNAAKIAGANFVKTSTGFGGTHATTEAVHLMRQTVGEAMGVKASGGVRTTEDAVAMVQAGANRIGTSNSMTITEETNVNR